MVGVDGGSWAGGRCQTRVAWQRSPCQVRSKFENEGAGSGCGKSTIIGLIERFYDPLKGVLLIDGQDIRSFNLRSLRQHIALVGQEPTLFAGSIKDNIVYGKENATETEIVEAAKALTFT
jgi:ABC-type bacteriocin/lantibiotic exporter with double-glycine peptidase domain